MLKRTLAILMAAFLMQAAGNLFAYPGPDKPQVIEFQIESKALGEQRTITYSLPDDYYTTGNTYPVLYLLDGKTHFQHANAAVSFLSGNYIIPKMIVVSIHNVDRNRDFSPAHEERIPTSGGADRFLAFLKDELIPAMGEKARVSGFSVLMGHSFGGNLAAHALNVSPELFDAFISVSPYLQFKENYVIKEAEEMIKPYSSRKTLFLTVGDEPDCFEPVKIYSEVINTRSDGTVDFKVEKMLDENHATIPYVSLFKGLKFIFSDWQIPKEAFEGGLEAIDNHYAKISSKYGVDARAHELAINQLGYIHLQNGEIDKAITVFTENVKRYPQSANVYDSLGEACENNHQLEPALKNYQKACEAGKKTDDPNYPVYERNMLRVKKELESR
jgi:predicted alpha/beta superfamily hydrolase